MLLINQWRMPLLFLVSGIASSFLLRKIGPAAFINSRSDRLLIPFLAGVILIVPPQAYLQAIANGTIEQHFPGMNYLKFLSHYFTFQGWPAGSFDGSEFGFTWNHLWFIPYLFLYTIVLIPVSWVLRKSKIELAIRQAGAVTLMLAPVIIQIIWQLSLNDEKPISHALYDDGYAHAMFGSYFLIGYLLSDHVALWRVIVRLRWITLLSAVACYLTLLLFWFVIDTDGWLDHLEGVIATFNQWLWLLCVMGWAARLLNQPSSLLTYANNRIYPWYILHQTITIIVAFWLAKYSLGGLVEFGLVTLTTFAGCYILTEAVIARSNLLKIVFGMK